MMQRLGSIGPPIFIGIPGLGVRQRMAKRNLKVVRLIEPEMCLECRFAKTAEVELADGSMQRMIHCLRLDCDNWDYSSAEAAKSIIDEDQAA
ncbi:hypothetical protein CCB80_10050 [Armatimonadetes bacterium Uphvl-Ar1]|nr:hypothetical protein CCB80_10050 [Armatimonadetes bacterium Uphvl-Ar1]